VPDRYHRGLAAEASIADNLLLGSHGRPPASKGGLLDMTAVIRGATSSRGSASAH
jgi:hypothetical protein